MHIRVSIPKNSKTGLPCQAQSVLPPKLVLSYYCACFPNLLSLSAGEPNESDEILHRPDHDPHKRRDRIYPPLANLEQYRFSICCFDGHISKAVDGNQGMQKVESTDSKTGEKPMRLCGKPMLTAKNGIDRGVCNRPQGHGQKCGNGTCPSCGIILTLTNTAAAAVSRGAGLCRVCRTQEQRVRNGHAVRKYQRLGKPYTFPCGCSGVLPSRKGFVNELVTRGAGSYVCRVSSILHGSQQAAKKWGYKPIPLDTPHALVRELMLKSSCECCGEPLLWAVTLGARQPHLHHNHETGEIYGFTHPVCNPKAMENEIDRLRALLKKNGIAH